MSSLYDIEVETITGEKTTMREFEGKVALIVNVASACGFTPQYEGLQKLHDTYAEKGLAVLGFPCDQFGAQEPGSNEEIAGFCESKFKVGFPMFGKIEVNGDGTHPLYAHLKKEKPGVLGSQGIKWNFTKFLVDRNGNVVDRYASATKPSKIAADIEKLL